MKNLNTLTKEQKELIPVIRQKWLDEFYLKQDIDKQKAIEQINWVYEFCGKTKPTIFFMDSPLGSQIMANIRDNIGANIGANIWDNIWDNIGANIWDNIGANIRDNIRANIGNNIGDNIGANIGDNIGANIRANIWDNIGANIGNNIRANIGANIWDNIGANIGNNIRANIGANIKYSQPSYYANISDYGWAGFYDYFQSLNYFTEYDWSNFIKFKTLLQSGIYELLTFENVCIVSLKPKVKQDERNRLHCEDGPAVMFKDEFCMYFWHGIFVPEKWIINKESITKEDIMKENNAEKRRCLQEILGSKYAQLLDIEIIDNDIDQFGYPIELFRTKEKIQF